MYLFTSLWGIFLLLSIKYIKILDNVQHFKKSPNLNTSKNLVFLNDIFSREKKFVFPMKQKFFDFILSCQTTYSSVFRNFGSSDVGVNS